MINFKKEFYKRFVRMEDYLEDTSEFKEAISALLAENINLDKGIPLRKVDAISNLEAVIS